MGRIRSRLQFAHWSRDGGIGGLEHVLLFHIYWVASHPTWRTRILQRGCSTTNQIWLFTMTKPKLTPIPMFIDQAKVTRCYYHMAISYRCLKDPHFTGEKWLDPQTAQLPVRWGQGHWEQSPVDPGRSGSIWVAGRICEPLKGRVPDAGTEKSLENWCSS